MGQAIVRPKGGGTRAQSACVVVDDAYAHFALAKKPCVIVIDIADIITAVAVASRTPKAPRCSPLRSVFKERPHDAVPAPGDWSTRSSRHRRHRVASGLYVRAVAHNFLPKGSCIDASANAAGISLHRGHGTTTARSDLSSRNGGRGRTVRVLGQGAQLLCFAGFGEHRCPGGDFIGASSTRRPPGSAAVAVRCRPQAGRTSSPPSASVAREPTAAHFAVWRARPRFVDAASCAGTQHGFAPCPDCASTRPRRRHATS